MPDDDAPDALAALLERLAGSEAPVPTSAFGRLRRGAGAALRAAASGLGRGGLAKLDEAALGRLVASLGELKGIAMKMGQLLSYVDDALPPESRRLLAVLQRHSPPMPLATVRAIVREELGAAAELILATLEPVPVASASIGQVHRARVEGAPVAVKVRHPGIDEAIRADFRAARAGVAFARLLLPGGDVKALVDEAREAFLEECDYALEARRQERFRSLFAGDPDLAVPAVFPRLSAARVLTTEWRDGRDLDAFLAAPQPARDRAGAALYRFYAGTVYRHGLFNADPHPGNLLFDPGGAVAILDFGCVREFAPGDVARLAALSAAVREGSEPAMRDALGALGATVPPARAFGPAADLLRGFYGPILAPGRRRIAPGVAAALREVVAHKFAVARLRLPARLLFLFRIRFGLYAVLARLGAEADWRALEGELAGR